MSKYSFKELEFYVGYQCSLEYYGAIITGIITRVYLHNNEEFIIISENGREKEPFWSKRVISVPILDKVKDKKLWKLIQSCIE